MKRFLRLNLGLLFVSILKIVNISLFSRQWPSSKLEITCPPHLREPYEDQFVEVCTSNVSGGGEGLCAKVDIPVGTIVSYYHGVRMKPVDEILFGKATGYAIYLEWDVEAKETSDILLLDFAPQVCEVIV